MTATANRRAAALAMLNGAPLTAKEGGFVGQMAFADEMTPKQARWFDILLDRHGLPDLREWEASDGSAS